MNTESQQIEMKILSRQQQYLKPPPFIIVPKRFLIGDIVNDVFLVQQSAKEGGLRACPAQLRLHVREKLGR
jgi:hypothetical protein